MKERRKAVDTGHCVRRRQVNSKARQQEFAPAMPHDGPARPALPAVLIAVLAPLAFLALAATNHAGPAYLADEIGYLAKASFLAGHRVDGSSSYHGGYSILLAPLFRVFDSPAAVWQGVLLVNALLWTGSLLLLNRLLTVFFDDITPKERWLALLLAALYPTCITMAGYAFATSAFVFFYLLCLASVPAGREPLSVRTVLVHSLCVGWLYWVHPAGLGIAIASCCTIFSRVRRRADLKSAVWHSLVVSGLILAYKYGLHAWMNEAMTPPGYTPRHHYPEVGSVFRRIATVSALKTFSATLAGQFLYLGIASFGLIAVGAGAALYRSKSVLHRNSEAAPGPGASAGLFQVLSLLFVAIIGAAMFAAERPQRVDHWLYGRYVDGVALPLLAIGAVALHRCPPSVRVRTGAAVCIALALAGALLQVVAPGVETLHNNIVNTVGLWPQYLLKTGGYATWALMGAAAVGLCFQRERLVLVALACSFLLGGLVQYRWHRSILAQYSRPSSLIDAIGRIQAPGRCVGIDFDVPDQLDLMRKQRPSLYLFYLYRYDVRRVSDSDWPARCDGPLLTYNPDRFVAGTDARAIAREVATGLFLVARPDRAAIASAPDLLRRADVEYLTDTPADRSAGPD